MSDGLRAGHAVAFTYRRSVGGVVAQFLSGLARRELWGSRAPDGSVTVPPLDWDPETGEPSEALVRVGETGVVRSWTWVAASPPGAPPDRPFALALIQLEGADTALLHVVDVPDASHLYTGMPVRAEWRSERVGSILDIRAFVPAPVQGSPPPGGGAIAGEGAGAAPEAPTVPAAEPPHRLEDLSVVSDVRLSYSYEPGLTLSRFFRALGTRRIQGGRCPSCGGVYVPPHPRCPACRVGPMEPVELGDRGTVASFTVCHVPFHGMTIDLPFVCAWIRLDGADVPFAHLLGEVAPEAVRVGQRVEAVWVPDDELGPTWESIVHFRPGR